MPKIEWTGLPPALRDHLFDRARERKVSIEDLYQLKLWRESEPEAPDGPWYKDFGSFKSVAYCLPIRRANWMSSITSR